MTKDMLKCAEEACRPAKHYLVHKLTAEFCRKHPEVDIQSCFLPIAMCELNSIELAWGFLKGQVRRHLWEGGFDWKDLDRIIKEHSRSLGSKNFQGMWDRTEKQLKRKAEFLAEQDKKENPHKK